MRVGISLFAFLFWIFCATLQGAAIEAGLQASLHWHWLPATIAGIQLGILPLIGNAAGVWGAMAGFHWALSLALLLIIGVPLIGGFSD
jgi:hypothetical protein